MKGRFLLFGCLALFIALTLAPMVALAEDGDDGGDEGDDNPWGEAAIDHKLNAGWDYPSDYVQRPLVYNKRVVELGLDFQYKYMHDYWNDNGELMAGSFKTKKQTLNFSFGGGISDNLSASINWPFVYKKTILFAENENYRRGRKNTYGVLAEEAVVKFLDHSDPWKLWEMDLPQLGDLNVWIGYQFFRRLDPTTSIIYEMNVKFPTGNDNPRRSAKPRNYMTSGQTDWYNGVAIKQSAWKFGFEFHIGYNWRMPADTQYTPGELDLADQALADGEIAFQVPGSDYFGTFVLACAGHYMYRVVESTVEDNVGEQIKLQDNPGFTASVEPKLIYQWKSDLDVYFTIDIPMAGENTFLVYSRSYYKPPYDIEGNDGVGVNYTLGLKKRWQ